MLEFLPVYAQHPPLFGQSFSKQAPGVVFGVVLILIMFAVPAGAAGLLRRIVRPLTKPVPTVSD